MGLIKQIDDQLGRLFAFMAERGLLEHTLIVFTSDHGDYLGDHWMGEKDLFHEPSVKIPLIICDPSAEADATRGTVCDALVEAIDLAPTFLEAVGADPAQQSHRLEGRSLMPFLTAKPPAEWRRFVFSEYDYSLKPVAAKLGRRAARRAPVHGGGRALEIRARHRASGRCSTTSSPTRTSSAISAPTRPTKASASAWRRRSANGACRLSQRTTRSEQQMRAARGSAQRRGILIGVWDESELPAELWSGYLGEDK